MWRRTGKLFVRNFEGLCGGSINKGVLTEYSRRPRPVPALRVKPIPAPRTKPIPVPRTRPIPIPRKILSKIRPTPPPKTRKPVPLPRKRKEKPVPSPRVRSPTKECEHGDTEEISRPRPLPIHAHLQ